MRKDILIIGKNGFIGKRIKGGKAFEGRIVLYELIIQSIGVKGIVHLAAVTNKRDCYDDPKSCIQSNLLALCDVLEVALNKHLWVLFISTYQVREKNLYGLSKLFGEELCRVYKNKGLKVKILRLPIVYGPNDKEDKIVTKIIREMRDGVRPKIRTNDKFYFSYVDDIARRIENEVDILSGGFGKKYSLINLTNGIKKCLKGDKK